MAINEHRYIIAHHDRQCTYEAVQKVAALHAVREGVIHERQKRGAFQVGMYRAGWLSLCPDSTIVLLAPIISLIGVFGG